MLSVRRGTRGLTTCGVPVPPHVGAKPQVDKTARSSARKNASLFHAKVKTRIACWNVRTLGRLSEQSEKLLGLVQTMEEKKIELMALSETRWTGQGVERIKNKTFIYSGADKDRNYGVAIALSNQARRSWEEAGSVFHPVSERILRIRIKTHFGHASIIAVYAPTNPTTPSDATVSDAFYQQLQTTLAAVPVRDMVIIMGDLNARVGSDNAKWKSVMGCHSPDQRNENGERLLDFCACNDLVITNTCFPHKTIHKCTWFRNGDRTRPGRMIDYVLVNRRFRTSILDTRTFRKTHVESDHELVVSTVRFKIKAKRMQNTGLRKRQTCGLPMGSKIIFRTTLHASLPSQPTENENVEEVWRTLKSALNEAQETLPELPRRQEKEWVTEELRNLSRKKREAWQRMWQSDGPHPNNTALRDQYKHYCKLTRDAAERARNKWWSDRAAEAEKRAQVAEREGQGGSLIKELRLLKSHFTKASAPSLLAKDGGSSVTSDEDKCKRWVEHFEEVFNCGTSVSEAVLEELPVINPREDGDVPILAGDELGTPLTEEEIKVAVSQLRSGKAPGEDGITAEILRLGGESVVQWLKHLADRVWSEEGIPKDWKKSLVVPLHKKGTRTVCDNYRGISLLSIPSKVICRAILNRIKPRVELQLRESQCGFRKGRGCADQLFSLRVMMEKAREYHRPLYMCFIDLRKAYDSVDRAALWELLQRTYSLPQKLIAIIRAFHEHSTAAVRAYGKVSEEFEVTSGVRQGCVLAPTLFNMYFDAVIHMALEQHRSLGRGIVMLYQPEGMLVGNRRFNCRTLISDLEYADDMTLVAASWEDLKAMLQSLDEKCQQMGLTISTKKTKTMAVLPSGDSVREQFPRPEAITLRPDSDPVKVVSNFEYLGSTMSDDCSLNAEVEARISKASRAFSSLSRILWYQRKIKQQTKIHLFNSVIVPVLTYGLESVALSMPHQNRLQSFVMRCLRIILGISLREEKRSTEIRKVAKQQRMSSVLMRKRLCFVGHVERMKDERVPKKLLVCAPEHGKRSAGGQRLRWSDVLTRDLTRCGLDQCWREKALERDSWRQDIAVRTEKLNAEDEKEEQHRKDEKRRRRVESQMQSEAALACDWPGCTFQAVNRSGLINHQRQSHSTPQLTPCPYCGREIRHQGLHNHKRFCKARPAVN